MMIHKSKQRSEENIMSVCVRVCVSMCVCVCLCVGGKRREGNRSNVHDIMYELYIKATLYKCSYLSEHLCFLESLFPV